MKRFLAIFLTLSILLALTACGAKSANDMNTAKGEAVAPSIAQSSAAAEPEEKMDVRQDVATKLAADANLGPAPAPAGSQRKIIKNADIIMESREFDDALTKINALIEKYKGYVENSSYSGNKMYSDVNRRSAHITARVPSDQLSGAATELASIGNVISKNENSNDITDAYYDVDARLKSLKIQEERYLELLKKAAKMEDIITLENALTNVRYEIENLTSQQKRYDQQVAYSTINIDLQEVGDYSVVREQPLSFGERISNAFKDSLLYISRSAQSFVVFLVAALPIILVYGVIILVIVLIVVKFTGIKKPKQKLPPPPENKTEE